MKTQDIESYLSSFPNYEVNLTEKKYVDFSLCRIHALLKKMCDPQEALTIVHVAGSKGKGSTCVMVAHILKAAGYVVGLYTSPHLYRLNERIRLLRPEQDKKKIRVASGQVLYDDEIAAEELADVIRALKPVLDGSRFHPEQGYLTYFELLTALGLYYFREQKADVAVLETGLGGRYDATNSVDADCIAITSISLEHTALLGTSLPAIAREKVAIVKHSDQRVVLAPQSSDVLHVLQSYCARLQVNPIMAQEPIGGQIVKSHGSGCGQVFNVQSSRGRYKNLFLPLLGAHQRINAAVAIELAEQLKALSFKVHPQDIRQGLSDIFWPIRFEVLQHAPVMILDAAHNAYSMSLLAQDVQDLYPQRKVYALVGFLKDKNVQAMFDVLSRFSDEIIVTQSHHPRAYACEEMDVRLAKNMVSLMTIKNVEEAVECVLAKARPEDVIVVSGSIFVVAHVRQYMVLKNA
ncbi:MAG: bifunctional folylpolyglutamate synthase/dihydrofolate synthase [Candidatus Omnitrophica bacterium]|nr:bifunctional folylpolyglutamate synthase/dihydrofolate synthase [Candidatus Omnitrophota bacterium]